MRSQPYICWKEWWLSKTHWKLCLNSEREPVKGLQKNKNPSKTNGSTGHISEKQDLMINFRKERNIELRPCL
ncbi:hypothetical protein VIGAN_UM050400 [Vigna angularis var. angularis]|uniref:Uncharacterized protein n=1 Tax=Vigna angularis var. angularis TaxID=157739 RepID=A0A0S3TE42_PHAAN|nr:hypothetical protein VIGAN_UM050400 [Vigna angularis var. angularis]